MAVPVHESNPLVNSRSRGSSLDWFSDLVGNSTPAEIASALRRRERVEVARTLDLLGRGDFRRPEIAEAEGDGVEGSDVVAWRHACSHCARIPGGLSLTSV